MSDKKSDNLHCPCCKRHCSIDDLHCSKGKVYAKSLKRKEEASQQQTENDEPSFNRILLAYKFGFHRLFGQKEKELGGKKLRALVMGVLFQTDGKTVAELESETGIKNEKLKECLEKLEKKEYMKKKTQPEGLCQYTLSDKGTKAAEEFITGGDKEVLTRLEKEERDQLERLLRKLLP
ncbi:MAG: winged helix-turn-helix transcriptional regulator [Hungatella sp.]|nr:winged helix-turn-helix transcriptional regulator [Hungatella sp.]